MDKQLQRIERILGESAGRSFSDGLAYSMSTFTARYNSRVR